jgi:hypothetical protein
MRGSTQPLAGTSRRNLKSNQWKKKLTEAEEIQTNYDRHNASTYFSDPDYFATTCLC